MTVKIIIVLWDVSQSFLPSFRPLHFDTILLVNSYRLGCFHTENREAFFRNETILSARYVTFFVKNHTRSHFRSGRNEKHIPTNEFDKFLSHSTGVVHWYYRFCAQEKLNARHLIVVTGCDSGLGYSLALHCQALGATIVAGVLDPDGQAAKNLAEKKIIVYRLDNTDEESIDQFGGRVKTLCIEKRYGER